MLKVAELAAEICEGSLALYSCAKSPRKFEQPQLLSILIIRAYLRLTYRGVVSILEISPALQKALRIKTVPDHSTLQRFAERAVDEALINRMLAKMVSQLGRSKTQVAAMDATGLETTSASAHFQTVSGKKRRSYVKLSAVVLCGSLLPCAVSVGQGPCNDKREAPRLLKAAANAIQPKTLVADAGYDAEWIHEFCYEQWHVKSFIPPVRTRNNALVGGFYRSQMEPLPKVYRKRWNIESFMSAFKRITDSRLRARSFLLQVSEVLLKVAAYAIHR